MAQTKIKSKSYTKSSEPAYAPAYAEAGVRADDEALKGLLEWVNKTFEFRQDFGVPELGIGYFANVINLGHNIGLAIAADGVGTKILVAQMMNKYDTIGIDCVAMNVNDILCVGAEPVSMVDYIAVQILDKRCLEEIAKGLYDGAKKSRISIPGGEVAQIKEMIKGSESGYAFDLVGTCIGVVPLDHIILGQNVSDGDVVLGLRSNGIHSNGLSLARKIFFRDKKFNVDTYIPELERTIGEELLRPTHIYVPEVLEILRQGIDVHALVHITSDGFLNFARIAADFGVVIDYLPEPHPIFSLIQTFGNVSNEEMFFVYNMGIGFCLVLPDDDDMINKTRAICKNHEVECYKIGHMIPDEEKKVIIEPKKLIGYTHEKTFKKEGRSMTT